jgi:hypothetical protein
VFSTDFGEISDLEKAVLQARRALIVDDFSEIIYKRVRHSSIRSSWFKVFNTDFGEISDL